MLPFFRYSGGSVVKESSGFDGGSGCFCVEFVFIHVVLEVSVRVQENYHGSLNLQKCQHVVQFPFGLCQSFLNFF